MREKITEKPIVSPNSGTEFLVVHKDSAESPPDVRRIKQEDLAKLAGIGKAEIFWATSGVTQIPEIMEAVAGNKLVLLRRVNNNDADIYRLSKIMSIADTSFSPPRNGIIASFTHSTTIRDRFVNANDSAIDAVDVVRCTCKAYYTDGILGATTWSAVRSETVAPLYSPSFTGAPTAPTPEEGDSSNRIATTAFVSRAMEALPARNYVTPEMYGAVGDGVNDDGPALKAALESGRHVRLTQDLYLKTAVAVWDKDIYLDGGDHTIFFDGAALGHTSYTAALLFRATVRNDTDGKIKQITDPVIMRPVDGSSATYQRGYISYDGRHPIPGEESYDGEIVTSWDEHTAKVRNLTVSCRNCAYFAALDIQRMCHVEVVNVSAICEDENGDGAVGINISQCYHVRLNRCFASNWTAYSTAHLSNLGYGIVGNGDDVIVSDCSAENCKHDFSAGNERQYYTTGLIVSNFHAYTNWRDAKRSNNTGAYQQCFDIHANALNPIVTNLYLVSENHDSQHPGNWMINIRCPEATLSNIYAVSSPSTGYITVTEFANRIVFNNIYAPNSSIRLYNDGASADMESVEFNGGRCKALYKDTSRHIQRIAVRNFEVSDFVRRFEGAEFVDCHFPRLGHSLSQPTIEASGTIVFRGCTIYGNRESNDDKSLGFIGLLDGTESAALRFYDCRFICDPRKAIFRLPVWTSGCWAEDFSGNEFQSVELIPSWIDATLTRSGYAADAAAVGQAAPGGGGQSASPNALGAGRLGTMRLGTRAAGQAAQSGGGQSASPNALGTCKLGSMRLGTRSA